MITPESFDAWQRNEITQAIFKVLSSEREEFIKEITSENDLSDSATAKYLGSIRTMDLIVGATYSGVKEYLETLERIKNEG